jgi:RNA polymerase sigma-70 factor (ECF subfamily)
VLIDGPPLPRRARGYARSVQFLERLEPAGLELEDADTARLVARIQAGDRDGFADLYMRYFDRVYTYMRIALRDVGDAEDATQQVFVNLMGALPRYEQRGRPFRAWLFTIARHHAFRELRKRGRLEPMAPAQLERHQDEAGWDDGELGAPYWISDRELVLFIERLALAQRQVLVLRYMVGLSPSQIAPLLGRSVADVRLLHHRALVSLRARLNAIGRGPAQGQARRPVRRRVGQALVLRERRFALVRPWTGTPLAGGRSH